MHKCLVVITGITWYNVQQNFNCMVWGRKQIYLIRFIQEVIPCFSQSHHAMTLFYCTLIASSCFVPALGEWPMEGNIRKLTVALTYWLVPLVHVKLLKGQLSHRFAIQRVQEVQSHRDPSSLYPSCIKDGKLRAMQILFSITVWTAHTCHCRWVKITDPSR